jgi:hypothetical protein
MNEREDNTVRPRTRVNVSKTVSGLSLILLGKI